MARCEITWNPGYWPYVERCPRDATRSAQMPGEAQNLLVCDEHVKRANMSKPINEQAVTQGDNS